MHRCSLEAGASIYNTVPPHSAMQGATPEQFAASLCGLWPAETPTRADWKGAKNEDRKPKDPPAVEINRRHGALGTIAPKIKQASNCSRWRAKGRRLFVAAGPLRASHCWRCGVRVAPLTQVVVKRDAHRKALASQSATVWPFIDCSASVQLLDRPKAMWLIQTRRLRSQSFALRHFHH